MPLIYKLSQIYFPAYGSWFSFDPRKPDAFERAASSFEGHENHKFSFFLLKIKLRGNTGTV